MSKWVKNVTISAVFELKTGKIWTKNEFFSEIPKFR